MKYCEKCGNQMSDDAVFCSACGRKVAKCEYPVDQSRAIVEKRIVDEQQRQKEIERVRIEQQENERNRAIIERIAVEEAESKRKKKIKKILIILAIIIVAALIVKEVAYNAYRGELRNFATDTMDDSFTNVYADVVSISPEYFVYSYETNKYGSKTGHEWLSDVVCECKTVEGKTIWAAIYHNDYPGVNNSDNEDDYKILRYSSNNPMRLIGRVDKPEQIADNLRLPIGSVFILNVKDKPELKNH